MAFVPLHNHSDYSLLDGASQISKIVERACDLGMESIALTDHGVMYGCLLYTSPSPRDGLLSRMPSSA